MSDTYARVIAAAHSGAFGVNELSLPTAEQCRAGNYLKGRVTVQGMPLVIEVPQGQRRMGKSDGKPWSTILMAHYGYIAGTKGADGDALDIFIGPVPESQRVWVVNQIDRDGGFDEHKILMGFIDEDSARAAYMNSYERGWTGLGSLIACSIDQLKWWLKYGNTTIPLSDRALPHDGTADMNEILWDTAAEPIGLNMADVVYQLRRTDGEGLMLDAVSLAEIMEDNEGEEVLDALVVEYVKVERKAEQLRKIMASMGGEVTPVGVQVTPPFKQRGTTNVVILFELSDGQTVSIWFHNPDSTPNRILPNDELVSWSWRLNKKDVSILVAPEKGLDLNPREVARRIMKLAERNSARFAKANATRAQRMESIEGLKGEVSGKEAALAALDALFNDLTEKVEAKRAFVPATLQGNGQSEIPLPVAEPIATVAPEPAVVQPQEPTPVVPADPAPEPAPVVVAEPVAAVDRLAWEQLVYEAIELRGITRSDAQGIVEAQGSKIDELFTAGVSPADAATAFLGEPKPDGDGKNPDIAWRAIGSAARKELLIRTGSGAAFAEQYSKRSFADLPALSKARISVDLLGAAADGPEPTPAPDPVRAVDSPVPAVAAAAMADLQAQAAATGDDTELTAAKAFLQAVIDGNVDYYDPDLVSKLELIHDSHTDSDEVMALFGLAAQAFSDYMVEQTRTVI